jgi:hypothetical protein
MPVGTRDKYFLGCLGALAPIIVNLPVVDYANTLSNLTTASLIAYLCRVFGLCAVACLVVYLNDNPEYKRVTFFQLGIMGPAVLTAIINGAASNINTRKISLEIPSLVSSAFAQVNDQSSSDIRDVLQTLVNNYSEERLE